MPPPGGDPHFGGCFFTAVILEEIIELPTTELSQLARGVPIERRMRASARGSKLSIERTH
jgi:hypothetical protein